MELIEVSKEIVTVEFIKKKQVYAKIEDDYLSAIRNKEAIKVSNLYNAKFYILE